MTGTSRGTRRGLPAAPTVSVPTDHRFRRADVSIDRRRRTRKLLWRLARRMVLTLAVVGGLLWAGQRLAASDAWKVRDIVVEGNSRLSTGDVERLVEGLRGENILKVRFEEYESRLLESPWVADVTLFRSLPARVTIHVVERVPMALARVETQLFLVDAGGFAIGEYSPAHRAFDLPIVDGLAADERARPPQFIGERVDLARRVIEEFQDAGGGHRRVSEIDVSNPLDAVVLLEDDLALLHLGDRDFTGRVDQYLGIRPSLRDQFRAIDNVDLRFGGRVYVKGTGWPRQVVH